MFPSVALLTVLANRLAEVVKPRADIPPAVSLSARTDYRQYLARLERTADLAEDFPGDDFRLPAWRPLGRTESS